MRHNVMYLLTYPCLEPASEARLSDIVHQVQWLELRTGSQGLVV